MAKKRKNDTSKNLRKHKNNSTSNNNDADDLFLDQTIQDHSVLGWIMANKLYVAICLLIGILVGSGLGTAVFIAQTPRMFLDLILFCPMNTCFDMFSLASWKNLQARPNNDHSINSPYEYFTVNGRSVRDDASHPLTFAILRESIIREKGGFVHPDLGILSPAPSGATRGLGMVRETYNTCQVRCMPGTSNEKISIQSNGEDPNLPSYWRVPASALNSREKLEELIEKQEQADQIYRQEEVLLKIPLSIQMTRSKALDTLVPLIPKDVLARLPLHELDDAALLVLLLAHERGLGRESKYHPYISSLPLTPSCGFSPLIRIEALETISVMGVELGLDVIGWPGELSKASDRAQTISDGLTRDYGNFISVPKGLTVQSVIEWALCHVASRATAGSEKFGALRLVPMLDMVNHDVNADGFEELAGLEKLENGEVVDADENDAGAFIVRSIQHGRRKPLRKGQELLANYNVPNYSPLDWFVSLGFVPPERQGKWVKMDSILPKTRTYAN